MNLPVTHPVALVCFLGLLLAILPGCTGGGVLSEQLPRFADGGGAGDVGSPPEPRDLSPPPLDGSAGPDGVRPDAGWPDGTWPDPDDLGKLVADAAAPVPDGHLPGPDQGPDAEQGGCPEECGPGQQRCTPDGRVERCGLTLDGRCTEWHNLGLCFHGQTCQQGQCQPPACPEECPAPGVRECAGAGWRECGEFDQTDACREWSAVRDCPAGERCDPATAACQAPCGNFCEPFSVVLLPDTQYYTNKQPNNGNNTYYKQMRWILDHRDAEQIRFVIHLGDVTNSNEPEQWAIATEAHRRLDEELMPYSITPGNHDYFTPDGFDRGGSDFDRHFGPDRFARFPWYGGHLGSSNMNNYTLFEVGPLRFLVLSLEYAPRKDTLCWAEEVLAAHPDRRVIVATHCYLTMGGGYARNCPDEDYDVPGSDGESVWEELVSRHSNIFLVVSGHIGDSELVTRPGNAGNPVHQQLVDYQFEAACTEATAARCTSHCRDNTYTGNGWLRQLVFDPRANRIEARTFTVEEGNAAFFPRGEGVLFCSPLNTQGENVYASDPLAPDHTFMLEYDLASPVSYRREDAGRRAFNDRTINSVASGQQRVPVVASAPEGHFVVAWEDDSNDADGAGNHDVFVRGFTAGGCPRFADFAAHPSPAGHQETPALAMDAAGNFVVVWTDDGDDNGVTQIHARGFWANGAERFERLTVNQEAAGQQVTPAVAMAPDGRFVVAWADDPERDGTYQIRLRGFTAEGQERFSDRSAHSNAQGQRQAPALALDGQARFVVAWQDDGDGNGKFQLHARGFHADGSERFARFTVNTEEQGQQLRPALAAAPDGSFVVVWEDDPESDGTYQLLMRGFDANGQPRFADRRVSTEAGGQRRAPAVALASNGSYWVAWQDDGDGNGTYQVRSRAFTAQGAELRAERTVNRNADGQQRAPHVAMDRSGRPVLVWEDDMDGNEVYQLLGKGLEEGL